MRPRTGIAVFTAVLGVAGLAAVTAAGPGAQASVKAAPRPGFGPRLAPGDLLVSTSYYVNDPGIVAGQTVLPPGSGSATRPTRSARTITSAG